MPPRLIAIENDPYRGGVRFKGTKGWPDYQGFDAKKVRGVTWMVCTDYYQGTFPVRVPFTILAAEPHAFVSAEVSSDRKRKPVALRSKSRDNERQKGGA